MATLRSIDSHGNVKEVSYQLWDDYSTEWDPVAGMRDYFKEQDVGKTGGVCMRRADSHQVSFNSLTSSSDPTARIR